jgi:hypothetical protein
MLLGCDDLTRGRQRQEEVAMSHRLGEDEQAVEDH